MRIWLCAILAAVCTAGAADLKTEKIDYTHGEVQLQGHLAYNDAMAGKKPGVVVVHEWWGLNEHAKRRAEELAEIGYVGFAADMYGKDKITTDPKQAGEWAGAIKGDRSLMRARALAAVEQLKKHPEVEPSMIAVIGYCFGGTTALEVARSGADVKGVVSFHGGLDAPPTSSPQQIKAQVLVLHGADDPLVPQTDISAFMKEMRTAKADWQMVQYGDAVHSFTNPDAGKDKSKGVAYNESADRRSWHALETFLNEIFGGDDVPGVTSAIENE